MQVVFRSIGRMAAVIAVSSLLVTQGAFATPQQDGQGGLLDQLARVKHFVVKILSDIGVPKG